MPTPTYTALANITLGSTDSEIVFSSIPSSFRDLVVVVDGSTSSTGVGVGLRYNGDTGANYSAVIMAGSGSATSASAPTGSIYSDVMYADNTGRINGIIQIIDYSATDKHKTLLSRSNQASSFVLAYTSRWANTAAVTSVTILTATSSFAAGTTLALYGIAS